MNKINEEKRIVDLEYNLICDFIKLRNELGLTQKEMGEASNTIREIIAVIETRKKRYALLLILQAIIIANLIYSKGFQCLFRHPKQHL